MEEVESTEAFQWMLWLMDVCAEVWDQSKTTPSSGLVGTWRRQ